MGGACLQLAQSCEDVVDGGQRDGGYAGDDVAHRVVVGRDGGRSALGSEGGGRVRDPGTKPPQDPPLGKMYGWRDRGQAEPTVMLDSSALSPRLDST